MSDTETSESHDMLERTNYRGAAGPQNNQHFFLLDIKTR
jgi:hypothetical protein